MAPCLSHDSPAPKEYCIRVARALQNISHDFPAMLETTAIVLVILWLLGLVSSYTMGGFIHILLVLAIIMIFLRVIRGNKPLA